MNGHWRNLRFLALMVGLVIVAAACGGGNGGGTGAAESEVQDEGAAAGGDGAGGVELKVEVPEGEEMVDTAQYATDPPWTIGYSDASLSNSARVFLSQYIQYGASQYPEIEEVVQTNANDSPDKQISDIEDLLAQGVDCLIVAATSEDAVDPAIELAMSEGVPVVINERDVATENYVTFASINTRDIGRIQAEQAAEILGGEGQVVLLEGLAGAGPAEESRRGHEEVLAEFPGIEILATEYTGWSREEGKTIMENWLQAYPQIDAVISDSGIQNQGAYEAVEAAGRLDEIKVWTGDSLQAWIRQVHEADLPGVIVNRPLRVGELTVHACVGILSGQSVPRVWYNPVTALEGDLEQYVAPDTPGSDEWWDWWDLPEEFLPE